MISYKVDNLLKSDSEALVNTVNTVGIMGKGIALQFKEHFPLNFKLYQKACKEGKVQIGKMFMTETGDFTNPKYIINFPTKKNWRSNTKIEYVSEGLDDLIRVIENFRITSIAIPPLGCGNGGLDWEEVKPLMEYKLSVLKNKVRVEIFEPGHHNYTRTTLSQEVPKLTKARALVVELAKRYNVLGFDISHLEIQKLAYFLQELGQADLKLTFAKGYYGPYALNLKHLLAHLEGYYFKGQIRFQDMKPADALELVKPRLKEVGEVINKELSNEEKDRLKKLSTLIEGFESPYGLELLATVHWAINDLKDSSIEAVKTYIRHWSPRKDELMTSAQIDVALKRLQAYF